LRIRPKSNGRSTISSASGSAFRCCATSSRRDNTSQPTCTRRAAFRR
jgi:hypothetical protein